jgi:hypothetical protein
VDSVKLGETSETGIVNSELVIPEIVDSGKLSDTGIGRFW